MLTVRILHADKEYNALILCKCRSQAFGFKLYLLAFLFVQIKHLKHGFFADKR